MISKAVIERLEFQDVLNDICKFLYNSALRDLILSLQPISDKEKLKEQLNDQEDLLKFLRDESQIPFRHYASVDNCLAQIRPESSRITEGNALKLLHILELSQDIHTFAKNQMYSSKLAEKIFHQVLPIRELVQEIHKRIDLSGIVKDSASPTLKKIRQSLERNKAQLRTKINDLAKFRYKDYLVDDIVTYKNDRLVLAVKSEHVPNIEGVIQGYSDTGLTVYIEPIENNKIHKELNQLLNEEQKELDKILRELAAIIRPYSNRIRENTDAIYKLDINQAKARYGFSIEGTIPTINQKTYHYKLINGYHPLLIKNHKRDEIVPLNLDFADDSNRIVLISGPNAGGKTVSLKTVGLLQLMLQSGIPVPCHEESVFPVYNKIFVDIGDNQSIQNDLSTFTSHLQRIKEIIEQSSVDTLVLMDELGTGTDPVEGAALARAFLKKLLSLRTKVIATTHLGELKLFADSEEGIQNASMEFNEKKLESSYRLVQGIPGSSFAFYISVKMGISPKIIETAKEFVGDSRNNLEDLIQKLNNTLRENTEIKNDLDRTSSRVKGLEQMYERKLARLKDLENETLKKATEEAELILNSANKSIENAIAEIKSSNADKEIISKYRQEVKDKKEEVIVKKNKLKKVKVQSIIDLEIGDRVRHIGLGSIMDIIEKDKNNYILASGSLQIKAKINDLELISQKKPKTKEYKKQNDNSVYSIDTVKNELDLRGLNFEEAWLKCDDYLDHAIHTGWETVTLVHGKGTGVLREKINQQLQFDKRIKSKRLGNHGEGDTGVTVVMLRH
jgi:DNA mismatch repair protein MutS2